MDYGEDGFYGEREQVERLIRSQVWLARKQFGFAGPSFGDQFQDLEQAGWKGALMARRRYADQGHSFLTYAYLSVRREIVSEAKRMRARLDKEGALPDLDQSFEDETALDEDGRNAFGVLYARALQLTGNQSLSYVASAVEQHAVLRMAFDVAGEGDADVALLSLAGYSDQEIAELTGKTAIERRRREMIEQLKEALD